MKLKIVYTFLTVLGLALFFWNNSGGPAEVQMLDRTGSPVSPGPCAFCHNAGAFSPTMTLEVLEEGLPITAYEPGKTYKMAININATGNPVGYGFQAVALTDANANAGNFSNPPAGIQVTPLNNRQYAEHSMRSSSPSFQIDWTAPPAGTGNVNFYAAVSAVNGNNANSGDGSVFLNNPVVLEEITVGTKEEILETFAIYPNPAKELVFLDLNAKKGGLYQVRVSNMQGQLVMETSFNLNNGFQQEQLNIGHLASGHYSLTISNESGVAQQILVKQ
ncbi:MAG TPA: T9SS type A sorting domain-containing protein [Saprospiraceae bacterium]|nr:T9SS type A sorting domain-containing protein [Saprospiraceae bacterium]HMQ85243.1 T9SS type A sorting domain-containing protein [Saprospiraceae bacterium]